MPGLTNYWTACAVMAGFSQGGGVGLALSNWMVHGDPGFDVWGMDVARFGEWATLRYTNAKVRENYSRRFSIRFPNEELPAARPAADDAALRHHARQQRRHGRQLGSGNAALVRARGRSSRSTIPPIHRSNDFEHVGNEVRAVRERVGVTEIANFAKYEISGPGAEAFLSRLMTNTMPKTGRIMLTPMLNENGKLIGDFTIAKAAEDRFMVWGSSAAQRYHMRWFEEHLPTDGSVRIHCYGQTLVGLSIAGPMARKVLEQLCDDDVSGEAFRFMDFREMAVAGAPCMVNRISYTGDLGYEIWMEPAYQRKVYEGIKEAGAEFGIVDFGMRALLSMRLEKNFPTWFRELRPIYGPFEGSMDRFIKMKKNDFIGREAAAKEQADRPKLRRVSLVIDVPDGTNAADVMGDEPIWARVGDTDYGTTEKGHGVGAPRFNAAGDTVANVGDMGSVNGEWRVVGWVTSGGYAHYVKKSMAQGYVPTALAEDESQGMFEVEILGVRRPARINLEPLFDPAGERMRG